MVFGRIRKVDVYKAPKTVYTVASRIYYMSICQTDRLKQLLRGNTAFPSSVSQWCGIELPRLEAQGKFSIH